MLSKPINCRLPLPILLLLSLSLVQLFAGQPTCFALENGKKVLQQYNREVDNLADVCEDDYPTADEVIGLFEELRAWCSQSGHRCPQHSKLSALSSQ